MFQSLFLLVNCFYNGGYIVQDIATGNCFNPYFYWLIVSTNILKKLEISLNGEGFNPYFYWLIVSTL